MRRLPRLRSAAPAGFASLSTPSSALRAPACTLSSGTTATSTGRSSAVLPSQRYLSTTPIRTAQPPPSTSQVEASNPSSTDPIELDSSPVDLDPPYDSYDAAAPQEIPTRLVYPHGLASAPLPSDVSDPSYKPAETADGLEEVGGLAGWWDDPAHWGTTTATEGDVQHQDGAAGYVRSVTPRFGPATQVTDPAMLEALARRAVVEVLVVGKRKAVLDRLFKQTGVEEDGERLKIGTALRARLREVRGKDGAAAAAAVERADRGKVWAAIERAVKNSGAAVEVEEGGQEVEVKEAAGEEVAPEPIQYLTHETAAELVRSWGYQWKKAELRDPVVKFYIAKRIQQLTGRRIPDGKLLAITTIDSLIKQLTVPARPPKLAELVETKGAFKDLPNVRVFPRRVTPIDKEQMVGRWKIIVKELEKRDLPLTGTGDHGAPVEKKWIEGRV